jgi:hypothetical protein
MRIVRAITPESFSEIRDKERLGFLCTRTGKILAVRRARIMIKLQTFWLRFLGFEFTTVVMKPKSKGK